MKNLFKILIPSFFAIAVTSCIATTATDGYNNGSYGYTDNYSQGYSDGYRDGYYQSPDGFWYAPNIVYLDYNNNYYRNGVVYNSRKGRNNVIVSPRRSSLQNNISNGTRTQSQQPIRNEQSGSRTQNNIRIQPNNGVQSGTRSQSQNNNIRVQPNPNSGMRNQSQNNIRVQPQNNTRSGSQNNIRIQPQGAPQENNSQRSNGSR